MSLPFQCGARKVLWEGNFRKTSNFFFFISEVDWKANFFWLYCFSSSHPPQSHTTLCFHVALVSCFFVSKVIFGYSMKKDLLGKMYGGWSEIFACAILKRGAIIGIIGKFSTSLKSQDLKFFKNISIYFRKLFSLYQKKNYWTIL